MDYPSWIIHGIYIYTMDNRWISHGKIVIPWIIYELKGCAQNRGLFGRKFKIVRIGLFWRFQRTECGIHLRKSPMKVKKWSFRSEMQSNELK